MTAIKTILCPTDFSDPSESAIRFAIDLAQQFEGSTIHLLHVDTIPTYGLPEGSILDAEHRDALKHNLAELARRYAGHGVELKKEMVSGVPWKEILSHAEAIGADLIVIATHGRTGVRRLVLGSVAERVVRLSPVPVLTVRAEEP